MVSQNDAAPTGVVEAKRALRQRMRAMRRELPDRPVRSARITDRLVMLDAFVTAQRVLAYDSIVGEVETAALVAWCAANDIETAMPEDDVDASWPDVIVVPGTAFTVDGARLGQGGGWYDRFLPDRRPGVAVIGLAFSIQIVDELPTERHDVQLDTVVTEDAVHHRNGVAPSQAT